MALGDAINSLGTYLGNQGIEWFQKDRNIGEFFGGSNPPSIGPETMQNMAPIQPAYGNEIQGPPNQNYSNQIKALTTGPGGAYPAAAGRPSSSGSINTPTPPQPSGVGDIMSEVENAYRAAMDYASRAENLVRGAQPGIESGINKSYETSKSGLQTSKDQSSRQIAGEEVSANTRLQNALADARQALTEARMGAQQRFGRTSGIGRALGEYSTVNFQRAAGDIKNTYENVVSKLGEQKRQLEENYQQNILQLDQWKQSQLQQAQQAFTNKLLEIDAARAGAAENKSAQRIAALQDLKNYIDNINLQTYTYQVNLQSQLQAANQQYLDAARVLGGYGNQAEIAGGQAGSVFDNLMNNTSGLSLLSGGVTSGNTNANGNISFNPIGRVNPKDEQFFA